MTKDRAANAIATILTLCAVVVTGLVVRREFFPKPSAGAIETVSDWSEYSLTGQQFGSTDGDVQVVVFSDFQCEWCAVLARRLDTLLVANSQGLNVVFRHFPMDNMHAFASKAAEAAECAGRQARFRPYHDLLFIHQDSIGVIPFERIASEAGVPDTGLFGACLRDSTTRSIVRGDIEAGWALGVRGTPAVLVNNLFHRGAPSLETLNGLASRARQSGVRRSNAAKQPTWVDPNTPESCRTRETPTGTASTLPIDSLEARFGAAAARRIMRGEVCLGMTREMVQAAWGFPRNMKARSRGAERQLAWNYIDRVVTFENKLVVGFE